LNGFSALHLDHVGTSIQEFSELDDGSVIESAISSKETFVSFVEIVGIEISGVSSSNSHDLYLSFDSLRKLKVELNLRGVRKLEFQSVSF
jgi:hypothetical protein